MLRTASIQRVAKAYLKKAREVKEPFIYDEYGTPTYTMSQMKAYKNILARNFLPFLKLYPTLDTARVEFATAINTMPHAIDTMTTLYHQLHSQLTSYAKTVDQGYSISIFSEKVSDLADQVTESYKSLDLFVEAMKKMSNAFMKKEYHHCEGTFRHVEQLILINDKKLEQIVDKLGDLLQMTVSMPTEIPTQTSLQLNQPKQKNWFQRLFKLAATDVNALNKMQKLANMLLDTWGSSFVTPYTKDKNLESVCKMYSQLAILKEGLFELKDSMVVKDPNGALLHSYVDDSHDFKIYEMVLQKFEPLHPEHWDVLYNVTYKMVARINNRLKRLMK